MSGYRPAGLSAWQCLVSFFTFHNESLNVVTHAAPLAVAVWWLLVHEWAAMPPQYHVYLVQLCGVVLMFGGSSAYHLFMPTCTTEAAYKRLLLFDAFCVWACQFVTTLGVVHYGFFCERAAVKASFALPLPLLALGLLLFADSPRGRAAATAVMCLPRYLAYAARPLLGSGATQPLALYAAGEVRAGAAMDGCVPRFFNSFWGFGKIVFCVRACRLAAVAVGWRGVAALAPHILLLVCAPQVMMILGGYVNVSRLPARYAAGAYDWGVNSHVVFHVLTALGTAAVGTASYYDCGLLRDATSCAS